MRRQPFTNWADNSPKGYSPSRVVRDNGARKSGTKKKYVCIARIQLFSAFLPFERDLKAPPPNAPFTNYFGSKSWFRARHLKFSRRNLK